MAQAIVRAIPTTHAGVRFRSRLEAEWALNLDALGIAWCYEPDGLALPSGAHYAPDFWLPDARTWLEVKGPGVPGAEKAVELARATEGGDWRHPDALVVLGYAPLGGRMHAATVGPDGADDTGVTWCPKRGASIVGPGNDHQCRTCGTYALDSHHQGRFAYCSEIMWRRLSVGVLR